MKYSPECQNTRPLMITILLTVISVIAWCFAGQIPGYAWLLQLVFVCFATAGIQIFLKFVITKFEYICDDEYFYIYKSMGRKTALVGKLELINSVGHIVSLEEYSKNNQGFDKSEIKSVYTYTRNYKTTDIYVYITDFGTGKAMIKLEINDELANYVNLKIDERLKGKKYDDAI